MISIANFWSVPKQKRDYEARILSKLAIHTQPQPPKPASTRRPLQSTSPIPIIPISQTTQLHKPYVPRNQKQPHLCRPGHPPEELSPQRTPSTHLLHFPTWNASAVRSGEAKRSETGRPHVSPSPCASERATTARLEFAVSGAELAPRRSEAVRAVSWGCECEMRGASVWDGSRMLPNCTGVSD